MEEVVKAVVKTVNKREAEEKDIKLDGKGKLLLCKALYVNEPQTPYDSVNAGTVKVFDA